MTERGPRGAPSVGEQPGPATTKDVAIQNLRGLAVVLLVASHVYGLSPSEGLRQPADTFWHHLTNSIEPLRMPLFTVISGYVYALRPVLATSGLPRLVRGKSRRLLVPLVPLTAIVAILQIVSDRGGGDVSIADIGWGYVFGYSHLWFLYAIFWVFLAAGVLDAVGVLSRPRTWAVAWAVGALTYVVIPVADGYDVLAVGSALRLFPFFLLGYALNRHSRWLTDRRVVVAAVAVFLCSATVEQIGLFSGEVHPSVLWRAIGLATGTAGLVCLFRVRGAFRSRVLAWIGTFAFTIYLLHTIANAGVKITLRLLGVDLVPVLFLAGFAAAILLPVLFERTLGRNGYVRVLLLGEKPLPAPPRSPRSTAAGGDPAASGP
ncbi:acyltransferase family protein [Blastococcus sp. SYSU D00695]